MRPLLLIAALAVGCRTKDVPFEDSTPTVTPVPDEDGDGYDAETDCDDANASVHPEAAEVCDGVDQDCDGAADEDASDASSWYTDADGDGYGGVELAGVACQAPEGSSASSDDCQDQDPAYHPGAEENDCADPNDYNCDGSVGYADADGDGYAACQECEDGDASVHPEAAEVCDGVDQDCDGTADEGVTSTWYQDADGDGYGDPDFTSEACEQPAGYSGNSDDCDDGEISTHPGADEVCGGGDEDCDGEIDEDSAIDASTWYADTDGDGFGDPDSPSVSCEAPSGSGADNTDCDDTDPDTWPGADEVCGGGDEDCDGEIDEDSAIDASTWYADADGDGFGDPDSPSVSCEAPSGSGADNTDCDDTDPDTWPGADEICGGGDEDCDGEIDEDSAIDASTWYADTDGDGYGDPDSSSVSCTQPSGSLSDSSDCDDSEGLSFPGNPETCDSLDNNCDGDVDEGVCLDISNVDPSLLDYAASSVTVSASGTINTDTGAISGLRSAGTGLVDGIWFEVATQSSGPSLGVFVFDGLTIPSGLTLTATGTNGLVILSADDVLIAGTLDGGGADGSAGKTTSGPNSGGSGGPGASSGGKGSANTASGATAGSGSGAGGVPTAGVHYGNGGGGAGHCVGGGGGMGDRPSKAGSAGSSTAGGAGGYGGGDGGRGGNGGGVYGVSTLSPLTGGSGGGGGVADTDYNPNGGGGGGGGGGGAVQLSVQGTLTVSGAIYADGGDAGDAWGGGGGGGSGGGLLLEALDLNLSGTLDAGGGAGGDGNLLWASSSSTGGAAGDGISRLTGGGGQTESGGGGGASGWLHLRYRSTLSTTGSFAPTLSSSCGSTAAM